MTVTELPILKPAAASFTGTQARDVVNAINGVIAAASTDGVRPIICSVLVDMNAADGTVTFTATDSYRAHIATCTTVIIERNIVFMVDAKQLKAALPKPSTFKDNGPDLQLMFHPGPKELDSGQFGIRWDTNSVVLEATPQSDGKYGPTYPNVGKFATDFATDFHHNGTCDEPVGFNPAYLGDIATACKRLKKDHPVAYTPGSTSLKPSMWEMKLRDSGIHFQAILMPVRLHESY